MAKIYNISNNRVRIARVFLSIASILIISLISVGCGTAHQSRIVRLMPNDTQTKWRFDINCGANRGVVAFGDLTNKLVGLRLHHGDVVLIVNSPGEPNRSLLYYLDSNKVATYLYSSRKIPDIFSVPIYHWVAPFDDPRNLDEATFFREGTFLGTSMLGYTNMIHEIQNTRTGYIFILGSLYDVNRGFGPFESPYYSHEKLLEDALKNCGTEQLLSPQIPPF